jgi:3-methyladenine DNA glycosylase AlkD
VPLLILCVQEPYVPLKKVAATALSEISKHSEELAHRVADTEGAVKQLTLLIAHPDKNLKKQVCACLANIAKHSEELAMTVTEADIFPKILYCLKDTDEQVRKNAANCIREIAKQSSDLANIIVHYGGPGAIVDYLNHTSGAFKLPGIMTLGFIAGFDESLAMAVIVSEGIPPLCEALSPGNEDHVKAAAAWSLGQIGRHSPQHAKTLCEKNVPATLLAVKLVHKHRFHRFSLAMKVQKI